jgi:hypothetical protein
VGASAPRAALEAIDSEDERYSGIVLVLWSVRGCFSTEGGAVSKTVFVIEVKYNDSPVERG